jgi:hypothetical protein
VNVLRQWFVYHHGEGAEHQLDLYRCMGCQALVTHRIIQRGGCACGMSKVRPTNPTFAETIGLFCLPWLYA